MAKYIYNIYATQGSFGIDDEIWSDDDLGYVFDSYKECRDAAFDMADNFFYQVNEKYHGGRGNEPFEVKIGIYRDKYADTADGDDRFVLINTDTLYPYADASGYEVG